MATKVQYYGTGRRKTAVARVRLLPGDGNITINGKTFETYFPNRTLRLIVMQPMVLTETAGRFDVVARVHGGGVSARRVL